MLASTTVFVAAVAGGRAIRKATDALMLVDRLRLLVCRRGVAVDARKAGVVRRNLMTVVAHRAMVRNREVRMVKRRAQPA